MARDKEVACGTCWGKKKIHNVLVGRLEGKSLLECPRRRWKYNI
jgi:hypothetical protein